MYISLKKKTKANQGQPQAFTAARQGELLHMLYNTEAHSISRQTEAKVYSTLQELMAEANLYCSIQKIAWSGQIHRYFTNIQNDPLINITVKILGFSLRNILHS